MADQTLFRRVVAQFEKRLLESALRQAAGNRSEAARRLGLSRLRFYQKAWEHGIIERVSEHGRARKGNGHGG